MTEEERNLLFELNAPGCSNELRNIISNISTENPYSDTLFMGKYQVFLLEYFLPYQKPLGESFQISLAVCYAKKKIFSETNDDTVSELLSPDEVDGSPLPVIFDSYIDKISSSSSSSAVKQLKEKYALYPISENVGRKVLWLYTSIAAKEKFKYPLITLCYGGRHKSPSLIGAFRQEKFTRMTVNTQGIISKQEQLPKLSSVKLDHLSGFASSHTSVETSVFARYDVLHSDMSDLQPCKDMTVVLECHWSNVRSILEPIPSDCTCVAKIKAVDGDENTGVFSKYKEISLIMALHKSLQTNIMEWPESSNTSLMKNLEDFIKNEKASVLKKERPIPTISTFEFFGTAVRDNFSNLDFTDKLWLILKDCSSCVELRDGLIYIYDELSRFVVPPFVSRKNMSTIALAIKDMRERIIMRPEIDFHQAIKLVLEIGIEKLRKDYVMLFIGLELAPYDYLNFFLEPEIVSLDAITCLRKLHTVLELTVICLKCLQFPKQLLSEFVRNALKHYTSVTDLDLQHVFKFEFPCARALHLLNQMRPTVWEISFLSSQKDYLKQTVLHFKTTPTAEHVYAPKDYPPRLLLKNASYVFTRATLVQDNFV